jgi:hypothetical protein
MSAVAEGLILGVAWFAVFLIAHVALFRCSEVHQRFQVIVRVLLAAMVGMLVSCPVAAGSGQTAGRALTGALVMASLWVLYMPFYYVVVSSTSVRTLVALHEAPGRALPIQRLYAVFASEQILAHRLDSMVRYGNLVREGDRFRLTRKGRRPARVFRGIKDLCRLGTGG